jgi:acetolactate synthase I/II/III large subunit
MNSAAVIAKYIKAAGIRHVFGYPGDPNIDFIEAVRREGLEFVLARREGTAALMAQACGQISNIPGVCVSTLGPGSSNLVNGVANALLDRVPMLAFSGQIDGKREQTFTHQVLDHERMFAPVSKWATRVAPNNVASVMRRALSLSVAERPGPVHITVAGDVVGVDAIDDEIRLPPMESQGGVAEFYGEFNASLMRNAKRPIIVIGISASRAGAGLEITQFAESQGMPMVVAPMAKGVIDETHPYFAGILDMACSDFLWDFLSQADLIYAIGFDAVELIKPWSPKANVIHIDSTPNTDQIYPAGEEYVGNIAAIVRHLSAELSAAGPKWSEKEIAAHREQLSALYYAGRVAGKLNPTDVIDIVQAAMPDNAVVTSDVGSHKLLVGQGWTTRVPKGVLMTNGLSSMGYSLPAAIAAKLMMPDRQIVCFTGDGGLAMVQGELRLAASLKLGIIVVVFCDNSLNRIELKQMSRQLPSEGTRIDSTDITKLAESMGCAGIEIDSGAGLEKVLADSRPMGHPLVIGANIDPAQYLAQF